MISCRAKRLGKNPKLTKLRRRPGGFTVLLHHEDVDVCICICLCICNPKALRKDN